MSWFSAKEPKVPGQYYLDQAEACERAATVATLAGDNQHATGLRARATRNRELALLCVRGEREKACGVDQEDCGW
jgi:hypothetical protein